MRWVVALAFCLTLMGCGPNGPFGTAAPTLAGRHLVLNFRNDGTQEMHILITRNSDNVVVGGTDISPGAHTTVTLTVPEDNAWQMFLEPLGSDIGPLFFGSDFEGCNGAINLTIAVAPDGNVGRSSMGPFC